MIVQNKGRHRSIRTDEETNKLVNNDYDSLTDLEKEILELVLEDMKKTGKSPIFDIASASTYRSPPISVESFFSNPYYTGDAGKQIYPVLRDDMIDLFTGGYEEGNFSGSIGFGKTTLGRWSLIRMLYEVSLLANPQETYDISLTDRIEFACFSLTEDLANEVIFDGVSAIVNQSPYFQEHFKPLKTTKTDGIVFPNNIIVPPGMSTERSAIGRNIFGCIIDEGNFFKKVQHNTEVKDYAKEIYNSVKNRMRSRFDRKGKIPGLLLLLSSKESVNSFTEKRILQVTDDPKVLVREYAIWDTQPKERFLEKKFRVAIGGETTQSRILTDQEEDPDGMTVIEVPENYRPQFMDDLEQAIRQIAGYSTQSITAFLSRRIKIVEAVDKNRIHPFSEYSWCQDFPAKMNWDQLAVRGSDGAFQPILNPSAPRHVHLDLSRTQDCTGFCVSHIGGWKEVQRIGGQTERAPIFIVDFILQIRAPTNGEISYTEIRKLIYEFSQHGFYIKLVTADSYQSHAQLETLHNQGYITKIVSVDAHGPYDVLKAALYEDRVQYYKYDPLMEELRHLEKNWKTLKVDHSSTNGIGKDCADALCGTITTLQIAAPAYSGVQVSAPEQTPLGENDETWVLERAAIPVEKRHKEHNTEDWKDEAEKLIQPKPEPKQQKKAPERFELPFVMG